VTSGQADAVEWVLQNEQKPYNGEASSEAAADGLGWFTLTASMTPSDYAFAVMPKNPPDVSLQLDWIFGYQAEKAKNNLRYTRSGHIIYHSGPYAISYDFDSHKQRIFSGHNSEVLCLTLHPVSF
jgi:hypothetical protein